MTDARTSLTGPTGPSIDPVATLRQIQATTGDLDGPQATILRVLWVRAEHPDTRVETELTHLHEDLVVFRALVALPGGATATGYASEPGMAGKGMAIAIERAETRAIGRALDILGYVISAPASAQGNGDANAPAVIDALRKVSPRRAPTGTVVLTELAPDSEDDLGEDAGDEPEVDPDAGEIAGPSSPATAESGSRAAVKSPAEPRGTRSVLPPASDSVDDPPLADYTWTHFWRWARGHNLTTKGQVEQRIGRPLDNLTPAEVRIALQGTGIEL